MGASAVMLASGAISASGQVSTGKANQRLANLNADLADFQAEDAIRRGREEANDVRKRTKQMVGTQRAIYGASGVDVNTGSAAEVQADTRKQGEFDALTVRSNAVREAFGYRIQGIDYRARGSIGRAQANAQATGTVLSSGSQAYYMKFGRQ